MTAFAIITIIVCGAGLVLCAVPFFRVTSGVSDLGHRGWLWFEHPDDRPIHDQPSEDAVDAAIPRRPLRGRWPL